jgi:hypothetical protein
MANLFATAEEQETEARVRHNPGAAILPGVELSNFGGDGDFWETPAWATLAVLQAIAPRLGPSSWHLIEMTAGRGAILDAACSYNKPHAITACELEPTRFRELEAKWGSTAKLHHADCMTLSSGDWRTSLGPNLWIGNPPYSKPRKNIGVEILERTLTLAKAADIVAFLLPLDFATGVDRCERIHDKWPCSIYRLRRRPPFGEPGKTGQRPFAWFVFDMLERTHETKVIG